MDTLLTFVAAHPFPVLLALLAGWAVLLVYMAVRLGKGD